MFQITYVYVTQLVGVDKYNWKAAMWTSGNKEKIELKRYKTKWQDSDREVQIILRGS